MSNKVKINFLNNIQSVHEPLSERFFEDIASSAGPTFEVNEAQFELSSYTGDLEIRASFNDPIEFIGIASFDGARWNIYEEWWPSGWPENEKTAYTTVMISELDYDGT
jgi:hypothetical protein